MIAIAHYYDFITLCRMPAFPKPIHLSHQLIQATLKQGEVAVDATLGNGHDALFLANLVGERGKVIGFDVQQAAVESATALMVKNEIDHFHFICDGHEKMSGYVEEELSVVMFNLGYLPKADKSIITTTETTIPAIEQAISLLKLGGLVSIMCYPGHVGGDLEAEAVRNWASVLPRENYRVAEYGLLNAPNNPPFLVLIEKIKRIVTV